MARIGSWGTGLVFEVSSEKILGFNSFDRTIKARWASHNINQKKPRMEYVGVEQPSVKLKIGVSAYHGKNPRQIIGQLENACKRGELHTLYVGGKRIGGNKMYIESMTTDWTEVDNRGNLLRAASTITFKEYN